jgi:hypothetical protein
MAIAPSRTVRHHERDVARVDRRWLVTWVASFLGSLILFVLSYSVYKATGPHPEMTVFLRQLRHEARWFIPGLKQKPHASDGNVSIDRDDRRHAAVELAHA